jgi:dihydropyrimidinase
LDTTATDNCTFNKDQKRMGHACFKGIPNGVNGIEDRMSIVWTNGVNKGVISPSDFVRVTSTNAAKIFNMYPQKGIIAVGSDADVVVWDPEATKTISAKTHHHACEMNIFEGIKVRGLAEKTFVRGNMVFNEGKVLSTPGSGRYVTRENYGFPFERIESLDEMRRIREIPVDRSGTPEKPLDQQCKEL